MKRIAVLDDWRGVALSSADWSVLGPGVEVSVFRDHLTAEEQLAERLAPFHIVSLMRERTPIGRDLLMKLPNLELLVTTGAQNAEIDLVTAGKRGITVCGTGGRNSSAPELTWGLIIALLRHIPREDRAIRRGIWQETLGVGLRGKTLGIVGLGKAGEQVAAVGRTFGMNVIAWSQNLTEDRASACGAQLVTKQSLLAEADVVTLHLVLSERTRGLIGASELALMRSSAYLINTSRGPLVDEEALVAALSAGRIAGAALDVFDHEPIPVGHPLLQLENVVLTPHLGHVTREAFEVYYRDTVEDIASYLAGNPLRVIRFE